MSIMPFCMWLGRNAMHTQSVRNCRLLFFFFLRQLSTVISSVISLDILCDYIYNAYVIFSDEHTYIHVFFSRSMLINWDRNDMMCPKNILYVKCIFKQWLGHKNEIQISHSPDIGEILCAILSGDLKATATDAGTTRGICATHRRMLSNSKERLQSIVRG